jgi:dihydrofolate synthase/folylpolyglutamate synthase
MASRVMTCAMHSTHASFTEQHQELVARLESRIGPVAFSADQNLRLDRIQVLLESLGNPHKKYRTIHVGGTAGKGSTATYISNILQSAGYKVGLFLSPYLQVLNEMYLVDGIMARTGELLEILDEVERAFPAVERRGFGSPSYFETMFAMAAMLFARHAVDVAVVEVGLGGNLDATNVIDSDVAVLVSVGLDHTEVLGNTVEKIAAAKVGIIKPDSYAVCGFSQATTKAIARLQAAQVGAEIYQMGEHFSYQDSPAGLFLNLPLLGRFQIPRLDHPSYAHNFACAAMACELFSRAGHRPPSVSAIVDGTRRGYLSGRLEQVQSGPAVILDGAHNGDKMKTLLTALEARCRRPIFVIAAKRGRELDQEFFRVIRESSARRIIATTFASRGIWTPLPAVQVAALVCRSEDDPRVDCIADAQEAVAHALAIASAQDLICVTGSFFLVGDVRARWRPTEELLSSSERAWGVHHDS